MADDAVAAGPLTEPESQDLAVQAGGSVGDRADQPDPVEEGRDEDRPHYSDAAAARVVKLATVVGIGIVVAVGALAGWLGYRVYQHQLAAEKRAQIVQVAKQGAVNLTTIDWQDADADVKRILDAATGTFYADFSKRSQPFIDVVKKTQSKTVGSITEAGLESQSESDAQVLVTVSVNTASAVSPEPRIRAWRMRIAVQPAGDQLKVANVEFVP
jgi:Mce-associated membrane protein